MAMGEAVCIDATKRHSISKVLSSTPFKALVVGYTKEIVK
jgi:hypothetical protein